MATNSKEVAEINGSSPVEIKIRHLHRNDFSQGFVECLNQLSETKFANRAAVEECFEKRKACNIQTFVATKIFTRSSQMVVGTISLFIEPKFLHGGANVGHIEDVVVLFGWRNKGIANKMLRRVICECKKANCYKIILNCKESIGPLYESLGFKKHENEMRLDLTD